MTISTPSPFNTINVGSSPNDGTGSDLRDAFIQVNSNFANITTIGIAVANIKVANEIDAITATISGNLIANSSYVPSSNTSVGSTGQIAWDSGHIYICVATNTWRRANVAIW